MLVWYLQIQRKSEEHLHHHHKQTVRATAPLPAARHQDPLIEQRERKKNKKKKKKVNWNIRHLENLEISGLFKNGDIIIPVMTNLNFQHRYQRIVWHLLLLQSTIFYFLETALWGCNLNEIIKKIPCVLTYTLNSRGALLMLPVGDRDLGTWSREKAVGTIFMDNPITRKPCEPLNAQQFPGCTSGWRDKWRERKERNNH